jgi:hypothetical protein
MDTVNNQEFAKIEIQLVAVNKAMNTLVEAETSTLYGAYREFAGSLNILFAELGLGNWYDKSNEKHKIVVKIKTNLYSKLKAQNHKNPTMVWKRVKGHALKLENPVVEGDAEGEDVEGDAEGSERGPRENRDPITRNTEELLKLYKFNSNLEDIPRKVLEANKHILAALEALGLNLENLEA